MGNVKTEVLNPEEIEFKFEITFTLKQWKLISENLDKKYTFPMSDLSDAIRDCTYQAEQVFMPNSAKNN